MNKDMKYEASPYGQPTVYFAFIALFICCFCIFIGIKTVSRLHRLEQLTTVVNVVFALFGTIMIASSRGIRLGESLWTWHYYCMVNLSLAYFALSIIDNRPLLFKDYDDDILDDLSSS